MASLDLTLKPAQIELVAEPGVSLTQAYEITNHSDSSLVLTTSVRPWLPLDPNGSITYDNVPANPNFEFSLANADLQLGQNFLLRPGASRQLVLKVKSLSDTPLSDSYFTFFISQDLTNTLNPDSNLSAATGQIGSHLLISTSKTENLTSSASISKFAVSPKIKDILFPKLSFQAEIYNQSSYFFKATGKITISKNNLTVKEMALFPQNVLAHSSRTVACNPGNNEPVSCTFNPPFWPGKYTATLSLDSSLSSPPVSVTFYVFPYSLCLIILLFTALFILFRHPRH
jgi:hypothetical protein